MIHIIRAWLDIIFPPSAHELILRHFLPVNFQKFYRLQKNDGVQTLSNYDIPAVQAAITACKFENNQRAARLLNTLLYTWLMELPKMETVLIGIPLSQKRLKKRGFNQVERVMEKLPILPFPCAVCHNLLFRPNDTKPQTSLNRRDRLTNMREAFSINLGQLEKIKNCPRVIICDDVLTTGATLRAAKATLLPHLSPETELLCVAFAH
ncbi:hypothetical protein COY24_00965 [Candidatus Uhrbacteria bacterium CG_4_10_14_0_2_um_filter_41_21]|nr:MAG: hypothetical protein COY24_00965 [Candidatus Uhrbacteria bacterium CG_4_10_14_0_2_um_filter_41_21]